MGIICAYAVLFKVSAMCLAICFVHTSINSLSLRLKTFAERATYFYYKYEQVCVSYFIREISITLNIYLFVKNS